MPDTQISTVETPHASQPTGTAPTPGARSPAPPPRPLEVLTIKHGSVIATPVRPEGQEVRAVKASAPLADRSFTAHQRQMLANLDAHGDVGGPSAAEATTVAPAADGAAPGQPVGVPAAPPASSPPVAQAQPPPAGTADAGIAARVERLADHNRRLVAELERRSAAPVGEPDERTRALDEIERGLTTDFVGSIRRLVALNAGIKDPASPDVDRLLAGGYAEWTAHELKMPMDPAQRAAIGVERNRLLIERDKRERDAAAKAGEDKSAAAAREQRNAEVGRDLNAHFETSKHGERYPLLMKHASTIDQASPGDLVFAAIRRGIAAGEFPPDTTSDETLINHYSKAIETHYQAHLEKLGMAPTSTATPTPAPVPTTDHTAGATHTGARTITNASASVAPPAPPVVAAPPAPTDPSKPKWRNEDERRRQLARQHFGSD